MTPRLRIFLAACGIAALAACAQAAESVAITFQSSTSAPGETVRLEAFVYRPSGAGPHPVVVFNHGSSGGRPKASLRARTQAEYFASRGFIVVVPMRRGRGASSGVSPEPEDKNCDIATWEPGLRASLEDISAVLKYVDKLEGADSSRTVLAGVSRGGFLSVVYAASGDGRHAIVGVINFVGGWVAQAEDNCPIDFNDTSFRAFGGKTNVPMLWLYGENDAFYTAESIQGYAAAFKAGGANLRFEFIKGVPGNGHWLADHPALWRGPADAYLRSLGLR